MSILTNVELGRGYFGIVYQGVDDEIKCNCAIKVIHKEVLVGGDMETVLKAKKTFEKEQQVRVIDSLVQSDNLCARTCPSR
jgi:hypothetical protein